MYPQRQELQVGLHSLKPASAVTVTLPPNVWVRDMVVLVPRDTCTGSAVVMRALTSAPDRSLVPRSPTLHGVSEQAPLHAGLRKSSPHATWRT